MAWINGQWIEDRPGFGGMLGSLGRRPEEELIYGGVFDAPMSRPSPPPPTWTQGPPFMPGPQPPFGDRPGMPNLPPQINPPGYSRGPQMQAPFGGGLGNIDQWNPAQPGIAAQYQPPQLQSLPDMRARAIAEAQAAARMPAPQVRPPMPVSPPYRPPMPPPPPNIGDVWPQPDDPIQHLPPDMIYDPPPDARPRTDHEFNVAQREKTKTRLAEDRAKTKRHYAKLRAKGASKQTIAKAKAKSKARGAKIKAQHPSRKSTIIYD